MNSTFISGICLSEHELYCGQYDNATSNDTPVVESAIGSDSSSLKLGILEGVFPEFVTPGKFTIGEIEKSTLVFVLKLLNDTTENIPHTTVVVDNSLQCQELPQDMSPNPYSVFHGFSEEESDLMSVISFSESNVELRENIANVINGVATSLGFVYYAAVVVVNPIAGSTLLTYKVLKHFDIVDSNCWGATKELFGSTSTYCDIAETALEGYTTYGVGTATLTVAKYLVGTVGSIAGATLIAGAKITGKTMMKLSHDNNRSPVVTDYLPYLAQEVASECVKTALSITPGISVAVVLVAPKFAGEVVKSITKSMTNEKSYEGGLELIKGASVSTVCKLAIEDKFWYSQGRPYCKEFIEAVIEGTTLKLYDEKSIALYKPVEKEEDKKSITFGG